MICEEESSFGRHVVAPKYELNLLNYVSLCIQHLVACV